MTAPKEVLTAKLVTAAAGLFGASTPADLTQVQVDRLFAAMCAASVSLLAEHSRKHEAMPPERKHLILVASDGEPTIEGDRILLARFKAREARRARKAATA